MKSTRLLMAGLVIILSACDAPAIFSSSLSEPGETAIDDSVVGLWYANESRKTFFVLKIARVGDDRLGIVFDVWDTRSRNEKDFRKSNFSYQMLAHPSELDGERYYNVSIVNAASLGEFAPAETLVDLEGFMIHKVRIVDDEWLLVYAFMEDVPERLPGWSESGSNRLPKSPRYSVAREHLRKLVAAAETGDGFKPFLFFRRLPSLSEESVPAEIRDEPGWKM
jgi:hypothetical protein